jgi:hypothetical protein
MPLSPSPSSRPPPPISWPVAAIVQSSAPFTGRRTTLVSGARPEAWSFLDPAPGPLLQRTVQPADTRCFGRASTRTATTLGLRIVASASTIAKSPLAERDVTTRQAAGAATAEAASASDPTTTIARARLRIRRPFSRDVAGP